MKQFLIALLTILACHFPANAYVDTITWDKDYMVYVSDSTVFVDDAYLKDILRGFEYYYPLGNMMFQFQSEVTRGAIELKDYLEIKDWLKSNSSILDKELVRDIANGGKAWKLLPRYYRFFDDIGDDYNFDRLSDMSYRISRRIKYSNNRRSVIDENGEVDNEKNNIKEVVSRLSEQFDTYEKFPWKINSVILDYDGAAAYFIIKTLNDCKFAKVPDSINWREFNLFKDWLFINFDALPNQLLKTMAEYFVQFEESSDTSFEFPQELAEKIRALGLVSLSEIESVKEKPSKEQGHFY